MPTLEQIHALKTTAELKKRLLNSIGQYKEMQTLNNGYIEGRVFDQTDVGVSAQVVAVDTLNEYQFSTVTNDSGYYSLYVLNSTYILIAVPFDDFHLAGFRFDVDVNDDTVEADILAPALINDADIYGTVINAEGDSLNYAWVAAVTFGFEEELIFDTWSNEYGMYDVDVMGLGVDRPYFVIGYYGEEDDDDLLVGIVDSIIVNPYDSVEVNLTLEAITFEGTVFGHISYEGDMLSGIPVWAENIWTDEYYETYTDENGYYEMGIANGEYEVCSYYWVSDQILCEEVIVDSNDVEVNFHFEEQPAVLVNLHGNFRFFWTDNGLHGGGFWPVASDHPRSYLSGGGMITLAYSGDEILLGGIIDNAWIPQENAFWVYVENGFEYITRSMFDITGLHLEEKIVSQGNDNFLIILSRLTNECDCPLNNTRVGYIMDWNVAFTEDESEEFANDDLSGVRIIEVSHPILTVMVPVKISYMMDDDGDDGDSPGYVGFATVSQSLNIPTHISIDLNNEPNDILSVLEQDVDDAIETESSNYLTLQMLDLFDMTPGDSIRFATLILASETLEGLDHQAEMAMQRLFDLTIVGIQDDTQLPIRYVLHQNYPNPFNPKTTIRFDIPQVSDITLEIFNIKGQKVRTLAQNKMHTGFHSIQWDGTNDQGIPLASGMYFYRLDTGKFRSVKKLVLMK